MWYVFAGWVLILLVEILWFSSTLVGNYYSGDLVFIPTVIAVTLVVGVTGFSLYRKENE
jgi:hypothetical protein